MKSENPVVKNGQTAKDSQQFVRSGLSWIRKLVQRFRVCWEAYPEEALVSRKIRKVGFSLELYGTHEPGTEHITPGCDHCRTVQLALKEIAEWILPREERPSTYDVDVDWQALSYSRERGGRADVRVTIRILHRHDWDQPIDECEQRCLKDMERALSDIGARKGAWRSLPIASSLDATGGTNGR